MMQKELQKLIENPSIPDEHIFALMQEGVDEDKNSNAPTQAEQDEIAAFGELCWKLRPELMIEWQAWFSAMHFQACISCRKGFEEQSKENSDNLLYARIRERIEFYFNKGEES